MPDPEKTTLVAPDPLPDPEWEFPEPSTDLVFDDGEPLESHRHRIAINVLINLGICGLIKSQFLREKAGRASLLSQKLGFYFLASPLVQLRANAAQQRADRLAERLRITSKIKPGIFDEKRGTAALLIKNSGFYFIFNPKGVRSRPGCR